MQLRSLSSLLIFFFFFFATLLWWFGLGPWHHKTPGNFEQEGPRGHHPDSTQCGHPFGNTPAIGFQGEGTLPRTGRSPRHKAAHPCLRQSWWWVSPSTHWSKNLWPYNFHSPIFWCLLFPHRAIFKYLKATFVRCKSNFVLWISPGSFDQSANDNFLIFTVLASLLFQDLMDFSGQHIRYLSWLISRTLCAIDNLHFQK